MRWARLVLAVSLLVGWTSAAAAECAWVLWHNQTFRDIKPPMKARSWWSADSGYGTRAECIARRDKKIAHHASFQRAEPGTKDFLLNPENASLAYTRQGTRWTLTFACFPDTIDPREKKE